MSMSKNQAKEPIVYVRKKIRKTKRIEQVVATVVASPAHQDFVPKKAGQKSFETLHKDPIKQNKKGTKSCYSSKSNTRKCKGGGARNAKISDNKVERRKTMNPQTSVFNKYMEMLTTEEDTNWNQLALVDGNIDYVRRQLEFAKDLGETAQRLALTKVFNLNKSLQNSPPNTSWERFDAKITKGKMVHQENHKTINFEDSFYAQRRNKGINICEKSVNEMAELLETNNNQSSGLKLQFQNMTSMNQQQQHIHCDPTNGVLGGWGVRNPYPELFAVETSINQVSPNYFLSNNMKEQNIWPRHYKPRAIVHPSKIISPCKNSDQNMQRTSGSAPPSFSFMKLLMGDEKCSTLTEELNAKQQFLRTSSEEVPSCRVQQPQQISFMDLLTREDHALIEMFDLDSAKHVF